MADDDPIRRFRLDGRAALVTGASSGLGCRFALTLARAGADVALCARRLDRLQAVARTIEDGGGRAVALRMDVTDGASVAAAFEQAQAALGPVSILVNNAGVPSTTAFIDTSDEAWRQVMAVNLDGVFRVAREGAQRMRAAGGGAIVNIASVLASSVLKGVSAYAASKAAVIQLTRAMALELARDNIRVNALAPGYVATEMNTDFLASEAGRRLIAKVPQARVGEPADLDGPLLLLASDAGAFITGAVLYVDGGAALTLG